MRQRKSFSCPPTFRRANKSRFDGKIISVKIVEEGDVANRTFHLHADLLMRHSKFFKAMLKSDKWKEASEETVLLKDTCIEAFDLFRRFIYTGSIFSIGDETDESADEDGDAYVVGLDDESARLVDCWKLGEQLMSTSFKDATTDAIIAKTISSSTYSLELPNALYKASQKNSKIRRMLIDIVIWKWSESAMEEWEDQEDKSAEFFYDVAKELHMMWKVDVSKADAFPPLEDENTCSYHEHEEEEGVTCYKHMF